MPTLPGLRQWKFGDAPAPQNEQSPFQYASLDWRQYVAVDPRYSRLIEVTLLQADPSEAKRRLGWQPTVTFRDLVRIMVDADLDAAGLPAPGKGTRSDRRSADMARAAVKG
ncbi:GDP-mannose 4,6-dehydratase [Candidatus Methylomirabilis sp.]|uniref:GDP-mannose 4,6-dehydratase n=1 Tax=Candidatus Methylomirabilis sp. TaxID=2032687 RepID=UPI0030764FFD